MRPRQPAIAAIAAQRPARVALLALATLALSAAATAAEPLPTSLQPQGQARVATLYAVGSQIYRCEAAPVPAAGRWVFQAPEADLFADAALKQLVGRHFDGPTWMGLDGSRVSGKLRASEKAPAAGAIPWLLLDATATAAPGVFAGVTSIQRVDTVGGIAGEVECSKAQYGAVLRVPYRATYHFLAPAKP